MALTKAIRPSTATTQAATQAGTELASRVQSDLAAVAAQIDAATVSIGFGGHFSCGKSTLLNALTGRALLPTSNLPETGIPCHLSQGPADRAVAVTSSGSLEVSCALPAIAQEVTLIDEQGEYRKHIQGLHHLEIHLAGDAVPAGVVLIDSPGTDDAGEPTSELRAMQVADSADLFLWVVDSRRPLAEQEQQFLTRHLATHGITGFGFVVNVFLAQDCPQEWEAFHRRAGVYITERIRRFVAPNLNTESNDGPGRGEPTKRRTQQEPPVVFVSARAAQQDPETFGATELRSLIATMTSTHPRVRQARLRQAHIRIGQLLDDVDQHLESAVRAWDDVRQQQQRQHAAHKRSATAFAQSLHAAVTQLFADTQTEANACTASIMDEIRTASPLARDGTYGHALTSRLQAVADALASRLKIETTRLAAQHGLQPPSANVLSAVRKRLRPEPVTIEVPNHSVVSKKGSGAGVGAVIGGILGSFIAPGAGTAIGAALGGGLGAAAVDDGVASAIAKDRAAAVANANLAGERAVAQLCGRQNALQTILRDGCRAPGPGIEHSDTRSQVEALRTLRKLLHEDHLVPLAAAAERDWGPV